MPRIARVVFPGVAHHVTQRGNRGEDVFHSVADRKVYLDWLKQYSQQQGLDILAYCLMSNHLHLVVVPATTDAMQAVLKPLHMRYAQRVNRSRGWKGHVWQGRYFSSPLDETYLWAAIRYVELNPVRAGIVDKAEEYAWSSAREHCGLEATGLLCEQQEWTRQLGQISNWSNWLAQGEHANQIEILRRNIGKGLPCGSDSFVEKLENIAGRTLRFRRPGRPKKEQTDGLKR